MRLLLDTHALIWWVGGDPRMRRHDAINDPENQKYVSAVSAVEIATKYRSGKLPEARALAIAFEQVIEAQGFIELPLTATQGRVAGSLEGDHKDPFDRMLAAQAILENLVLISNDTALDRFGVQRLW